MTTVLPWGELVARIGLAGVFLLAGGAKLADRRGTLASMVAFGVPASLAGVAAVAVPLVEILVGVLLVPDATATVGALAALTLLLFFTGAVSLALVRGDRPSCHCFGQLSSGPIDRTLIWRNAAFAVLALVVVAVGVRRGRLDAWTMIVGPMTPTERVLLALSVLALAAAGVLAALLARLAAAQRELARAVAIVEQLFDDRDAAVTPSAAPSAPPAEAGLPVGAPLPPALVQTPDGTTVDLAAALAPGRATLLLVVSPNCGPCHELLPLAAGWSAADPALSVTVIARGRPYDQSAWMAGYPGLTWFFDDTPASSEALRLAWTPGAVVVSGTGRVASAVAFGRDEIVGLATWARAQAPRLRVSHVAVSRGRRDARTAAVGDPVPVLVVEDAAGQPVRLPDVARSPVALVSWQHACPYCRDLAADAAAYAGAQPEGPPRLVLLLREREPLDDLPAQVLIDSTGEVMARLGLPGTPSAVLLDDGRVVSSPAVGAADVRALLGLAGSPRPSSRPASSPEA